VNADVSPAPGRIGAHVQTSGRSQDGGTWLVIALFLVPALAVFTVFVVLPMLEAAWYSFFSWNGYNRPTNFIGLENYWEAFRTPSFRIALLNVFIIIAGSLLLQIPLGLGMALLLAERIKGALFFRLVFFLPYVLAQTATGLLFTFIYDGQYGLLKPIFELFGAKAPFVLASPSTTMPAILFVIIWKYFGFHMMLLIAALQGLDRSLIEAATIDGATRWQLTRHIVLPLLKPTIKLCVFFAVLGGLQFFDLIMPLTGGGPSDSSQTLVTYLYNYGIVRMRIGYGSAVGVILFVLCIAFALAYKKWVMRNE
jgi:raffinose/stachyose/melibiose transport system permease protein